MNSADEQPTQQRQPGTPREVALYFLRLGFTAFGGPAAHIAMMREELVGRRKWLTDERFLDLLGATNLIPGPNSTEMAIHIGWMRAGWKGLVLGGLCFILPAVAIVLVLAWAYVEFGAKPQAEWVLYGIKPVIIAIVAWALWALGKAAVKGPLTVAVGGAAFALYLLGVNELVLLGAAAVVVLVVRSGLRAGPQASVMGLGAPALPIAVLAAGASAYSGTTLFLTFLKIGSVLFGSGYVLLAFVRADFVDRLGWLTEQQLLDAVAIGQLTPGPLFTTATFIGYVVGGWSGAFLATAGIFLPAFFFVAVSAPVRRIRTSTLAGAALDGVVVASLGLMAGVTWELAEAAVVDVFTGVVAAAAFVVLWRFRALNSAWLVLAGALAGLAAKGVGVV